MGAVIGKHVKFEVESTSGTLIDITGDVVGYEFSLDNDGVIESNITIIGERGPELIIDVDDKISPMLQSVRDKMLFMYQTADTTNKKKICWYCGELYAPSTYGDYCIHCYGEKEDG